MSPQDKRKWETVDWWMTRAAVGVALFFLVDLHSDFKAYRLEQIEQTSLNKVQDFRLGVHERQIESLSTRIHQN